MLLFSNNNNHNNMNNNILFFNDSNTVIFYLRCVGFPDDHTERGNFRLCTHRQADLGPSFTELCFTCHPKRVILKSRDPVSVPLRVLVLHQTFVSTWKVLVSAIVLYFRHF